jgi:cupin 2 domain-containing protein
MSHLANIFEDIPARLPEELFQTLLAGPVIRIERIISLGHASPEGFWYDQPAHEWILLLKGAARLQFEDQAPLDLHPGCFLHIPAGQRHRITWTDPGQPTVWLAIHYSASAA